MERTRSLPSLVAHLPLALRSALFSPHSQGALLATRASKRASHSRACSASSPKRALPSSSSSLFLDQHLPSSGKGRPVSSTSSGLRLPLGPPDRAATSCVRRLAWLCLEGKGGLLSVFVFFASGPKALNQSRRPTYAPESAAGVGGITVREGTETDPDYYTACSYPYPELQVFGSDVSAA